MKGKKLVARTTSAIEGSSEPWSPAPDTRDKKFNSRLVTPIFILSSIRKVPRTSFCMLSDTSLQTDLRSRRVVSIRLITEVTDERNRWRRRGSESQVGSSRP